MLLDLPNFPSRHVAPRTVTVWLPDTYVEGAPERFPVLYMHDGQNLFRPEMSYTGVPWDVHLALSRLAATGEARPAIVVGIWNTDERWREYMPQRPFELAGGVASLTDLDPRLADGAISDAYLRFIVEELKPSMDARFQTAPSREDTFVMGSSMGGLISLYAVCRYPSVFAGAGCLSTHWPAAGGAVVDHLAAALPVPGRHRLYFDFGTEELDALYKPYQRRVDAIMESAGFKAGADWMTLKCEGAGHSEAAWRERVHLPLRFLLGHGR